MIDHSIIRGCLQKDKKSEYLLYKQSFSLLMKVCYRYTNNKDDAMDFVNRGFLKILNNLDKYDFQHPYEAWIRRIMVNVIIDEFRKNKSYKEHVYMAEHQDLATFQSNTYSINDGEQNLLASEIMNLVQQLPAMAREVLNLNVFDGYSHKEIGEMMGISEAASKWHLFNARNILKEKISKLNNSSNRKKKVKHEAA
ncbi:MAG: RNA polymerase sigma factor [Bacteroidetes bacterium]|nr:RNA polymerase sigma factor [Bacteroidota bacterium]